MTPREPDRYDKIARDIFAQWERTRNAYPRDIAAALRQAADEALEKAAVAFAEAPTTQHSGAAVASVLRYLARDSAPQPAAAPAAEHHLGDGCLGQLSADHMEKVAPSLLPRVLAELEVHRGMWSRGLAAELRRYIATDLRDKRIADLEATSESHRLGYVEALARAREHQRERDEANKRIAELEAAIRWACGETDFVPPEGNPAKYWWRYELYRRSGLKALDEKPAP